MEVNSNIDGIIHLNNTGDSENSANANANANLGQNILNNSLEFQDLPLRLRFMNLSDISKKLKNYIKVLHSNLLEHLNRAGSLEETIHVFEDQREAPVRHLQELYETLRQQYTTINQQYSRVTTKINCLRVFLADLHKLGNCIHISTNPTQAEIVGTIRELSDLNIALFNDLSRLSVILDSFSFILSVETGQTGARHARRATKRNRKSSRTRTRRNKN